ncbi:Nucleoside-diphosphate-sugar epimerase [Geosmithia morbida]|uniref:Nucleoside-diphosphate-sugar epimerase n=1 Tax=Geosmithia morbida TaxID=1094350 RepID=A0A9P4YX54_9HYPO|nr:Nucleoside-diphosphate-sugar epimerase [Geosmithia morbida]KAF4122654.1 Nucleoside-diphosphate-sugar epimerase [Geosmithia morbida]
MADDKPSVLIIGGLGYIGRFLALHIHKNNLASEVRIVDKALPQLAWLAPEFTEACSQDKFIQADAGRAEALPKIFNRPNGKEWDYVFNCGGETRYSQEDEIYKLRSLNLALAIGQESAKRGVKAFVELSTGQVYKPSSTPSKEGDKLKPWSKIAKFKLQAEEELSKIEGLNLVIARIANVYGPYNNYVGTALCMARVYQCLEGEMKFLWTRDLCSYTVHVKDVARILWELADWYANGKAGWDSASMGAVPIVNVVDDGCTTQGAIADFITETMGVKTNFQGQLLSSLARLNLDSIVDDANDETLGPWADMLADAGITRPVPISPFMEKELLKNDGLSIDGTRLKTLLPGFVFEEPRMTKELVQDVLDSYKRMNWWP